MGLDVTTYSGLTVAGSEAFDQRGDVRDNYVQFYKNPDFPGRADDIEDRRAYAYEDADEGYSGSYGAYNLWREQLAKLAGYPEIHYEHYGQTKHSHAAAAWHGIVTPGAPFVELVNFSDCEGVIGATVAAKLAKDFAAFQDKADAHPDEWFRRGYHTWRAACEKAADRGALQFH